jgi:hypothetical protein
MGCMKVLCSGRDIKICQGARLYSNTLRPDGEISAVSEWGKEYKQNHNTIEPAPLGIEPNMICIETQQTGGAESWQS